MIRSIRGSWWTPGVVALASIALAMATPHSAAAQISPPPISPCANAGCPIVLDWWYDDNGAQGGGTETITDGTWTCQTTDSWSTWACTDNSGSIVFSRPRHQPLRS
jgi:hypothetical protein